MGDLPEKTEKYLVGYRRCIYLCAHIRTSPGYARHSEALEVVYTAACLFYWLVHSAFSIPLFINRWFPFYKRAGNKQACQISSRTPTSIVWSAGRLKNEAASAALRDIKIKRFARQRAMADVSAMTRFSRPI